ncbi:MAG: mechanosensitive ion channel domain-containing protein [Campylobacteraceae bacterium]
MKKIILLLFTCNIILFANNTTHLNISNITHSNILSGINNDTEEILRMQAEEKQRILDVKISELVTKINDIDNINKNNVWVVRHENYQQYNVLSKELEVIENELRWLPHNADSGRLQEKMDEYLKQKLTVEKKLESLSEFKDAPYSGLLKAPDVPEVPKITNPIALINGYSYIKQLKQESDDYKKLMTDLEGLIGRLKTKENLLLQLNNLRQDENTVKEYNKNQVSISEFNQAFDITSTAYNVYEKKINESIDKASVAIKAQIKHALSILISIVVIILISFLLKYLFKKFMTNTDNAYIVNKVINIFNVTIIILILLFAYIDNMTYMIAILGVASAGVAIAMKDMFMNVLGWMVITFGGSFRVGDRIKVRKDGLSYVGDIIDISLMRITMYEDVTLTTYLENKRSGRIVFVPNNYIFTTLIANYTHESIKTVWDGLYITITFDSNYKKAMYIIKEITKKYSKGYTDIARKQLNLLRRQYSLKNTTVEPRIFSFIEPHGLTIHVWFMTNSYAALALRSTISGEVIDAINKESDIVIAYPTQTLNLRQAPKVRQPKDPEEGIDVV